jgi:hypothetical protein
MSSTTTRKYRVAEGRVCIPPKGILTGPGATAVRFNAGDEFELPAAAAKSRYIRGRVAAGDLVDVTAAPPARAAAIAKPVKEG